MLVADVMSHAVATAPPDASPRAVARLMRERDTGIVVLVSGDSPVGVITDRDLALGVVAEEAPGDRTALAHASSPVVGVTADCELTEALLLMRRHGVRRVAVLDERGRLAGLLDARTGGAAGTPAANPAP